MLGVNVKRLQKIDNWLEFNQVPVFVNGHQIVTE